MTNSASGTSTRLSPVMEANTLTAWLRRHTKPDGWAMAEDSLHTGKESTATRTQATAQDDEPMDAAAFAELAKQAEKVGRILSRGRRGFFLTQGRSSMHFADIHTGKEILKILRASSNKSAAE